MDTPKKDHWDTVYTTKTPDQVSWTQERPDTALRLVQEFALDKSAPVIDIGGGDSRFADHMLDAGYSNITVLDISVHALERARQRLGARASQVRWITADISSYQPDTVYALWHDRAAFHFLTQEQHIEHYRNIAGTHVSSYMILGTFSENGPERCSNLPVKRYDAATIKTLFEKDFSQVYHQTEPHQTPFGTTQDFLFTAYKKSIVINPVSIAANPDHVSENK